MRPYSSAPRVNLTGGGSGFLHAPKAPKAPKDRTATSRKNFGRLRMKTRRSRALKLWRNLRRPPVKHHLALTTGHRRVLRERACPGVARVPPAHGPRLRVARAPEPRSRNHTP